MNEQEQMQFFHEMFHFSLARLGPGTEASTLRALRTVLAASPPPGPTSGHVWPRLLDLGCGTGAQTLVLAGHLDGEILAIDNHQPFLDAARRRVETKGLAGKVTFRLQDMRTAEFGEDAFDVIWSEGAIFCMGFLEGLQKCRHWLAPGGFFALTELCWLKANPPAECRGFFESVYPVMTDIEGNLSAMKASGYTVLDHFVMAESGWTDEFYNPLEERLNVLRSRFAEDSERLGMIQSIQKEIDMYRKYSEYYGYVFCVMRR